MDHESGMPLAWTMEGEQCPGAGSRWCSEVNGHYCDSMNNHCGCPSTGAKCINATEQCGDGLSDGGGSPCENTYDLWLENDNDHDGELNFGEAQQGMLDMLGDTAPLTLVKCVLEKWGFTEDESGASPPVSKKAFCEAFVMGPNGPVAFVECSQAQTTAA